MPNLPALASCSKSTCTHSVAHSSVCNTRQCQSNHKSSVPSQNVSSLKIYHAGAAAHWQTPSSGLQERPQEVAQVHFCGIRSRRSTSSLQGERDNGSCSKELGFVDWNLGKNVGNACRLCNFIERSFPRWKTEVSKGRKDLSKRSERILAKQRERSEEEANVLLNANSNKGAGDVSEYGVESGDDGFYDSDNGRWADSENEVGSAKDSNRGEYEDWEAEGVPRADLESQSESYWGEGEENRGKNGQALPSTVIEGNMDGIEEEDTTRFRLRNGREVFEERAYIVGIDRKGAGGRALFGIKDSLEELTQLADTAGLAVVGSTYQKLETPNPKTYIGGGKVAELKAAILAFKVETVIFDDELSPGQARNLEKAFGDEVRVCDRTALILDIFSQRAATREATLQVELAQFEYQLPRLTKMWTHLERQAGGMVKGMGEKQIEVDKRILRTRVRL